MVIFPSYLAILTFFVEYLSKTKQILPVLTFFVNTQNAVFVFVFINRWQTAVFLPNWDRNWTDVLTVVAITALAGVPRRQPHRRSGLATLPSVGAVP